MGDEILWRELHVTAFDRKDIPFYLYDNDGKTLRNLTGNTYTLRVWADVSTLKFSASLAVVDALNGQAKWTIGASQIDDTITTMQSYRFKVFENYGQANQLGLEEGILYVHPRGP